MASLVYYKNKKNGVTYVYENTSTWNKEKKRADTKRRCIGKLDPVSGEIIPTGKRSKRPVSDAFASVLCEGPRMILDKVAASLSLSAILKESFPFEWDRILTCAYYLVAEGKALSHVETWSSRHAHPYGEVLTSQRASELLTRLTRERQLPFFRHWVRRRSESEYVAIDVSSVSSYSQQNEYVRYGRNSDKELLPQINLCLLLGQESRIPIYYESLNGSIKDVSTLKNVLLMMNWLGSKRLHAVLDRGFYSEKNIDDLYSKRIRFTLAVPFTTTWSLELVEKVRKNMEDFRNFRQLGASSFFAVTDTTQWKRHRCYRHVYYDSQKAASEYADFLKTIDQCRSELEEGKLVEKHQSYYDRYFIVKETPKRGRQIWFREDEIARFKGNAAGYFIIISSDIRDPVHALEVYRNKDAIEKGFDNLKNALDMKRLRVHSAHAMEGRLFLQFIAQTLATAIRNTMASMKLDKKLSLPELMNELKSIHSVRIDGKKPILTTPSKKQREILAAFKISEQSYV